MRFISTYRCSRGQHSKIDYTRRLHLKQSTEFPLQLTGTDLENFRNSWKDVKYVIIDERSMVGCRLLFCIDARLRQIVEPPSSVPFGGLSVVLIGDHFQLPPVLDTELYNIPRQSSPVFDQLIEGYRLYRTFNQSIVLLRNQRHEGVTRSDVQFREVLGRLRVGAPLYDDWRLLMTRRLAFLPNVEAVEFDSAIRLYSTNALTTDYNLKKLADLECPVALITAHNNCSQAARSSGAESGLPQYVLLSVGARVLLTVNLSVRVGLVNGSVGTVFNIVYSPGDGPPSLPDAVLVRFDKYSGPVLFPASHRIVPILSIERQWKSGASHCARLQIPLVPAWALTIHKEQGATLSKAVVDIGPREFACGLTYVGLSRTKKLTDLALASDFPFSRLPQREKSTAFMIKSDEDVRLKHLGTFAIE